MRDDADRERFLETLEEACGKTGWMIHAWVLMNNHYHLLLETPSANLVAGMRWLQGTWTARFNARYRRCGHLFQGRYKALPVEEDRNYFATVASYIHLNPARAGLVVVEALKLESYRWSSYPDYLRVGRPDWLIREAVLGGMGLSDTRKGRLEYGNWFRRQLLEISKGQRTWEADAEWEKIRRGWSYGSETFAASILEKLEEVIGKQGQRSSYTGEEVRLHDEQEAERLLRLGLTRLGLGQGDLRAMPKGAAEKVTLVDMLKRKTTVSNKWIAQRLLCGHPSNIPRYLNHVQNAKRASPISKMRKLLKCED